ncbi:type II toxin-antitoxin system RelE/ParE family toxin [Azospirillum rugosum]|uniref:type II toxin-antitoxin system RelE/ParE family toxin n=1 Tax=Azospirillum rugosum TaxID=416170 RepID=UPI0027D92E52|nr:type II toxin-antitoxin system RelE/ParE family toxin [Azospirillum rugosum]
MPGRVRWTPEAIQTLAGIHDYTMRTWGRQSAASIVSKLRAATRVLREHPRIGRLGQEAGTRELTSIFPFVIVYHVSGEDGWSAGRQDDVEILRIWHGAQEREEPAHEDGEVLAE